MNIAVVDNRDSFVYNLVHLLRRLGATTSVMRNDRISAATLDRADKILLSPGPGVPSEAGMMPKIVRTYAGRKPILGVCLGHQAIGEAFGARLVCLEKVFHGVATDCRLRQSDYLFAGMPSVFAVGRYHSWVVSREGFPPDLDVVATAPDGEIMALRHRRFDLRGVQFHPESILTPLGEKIVRNWLWHGTE